MLQSIRNHLTPTVLIILAFAASAAAKPPVKTVRVDIQATVLARHTLLKKLNDCHNQSWLGRCHLRFVQTEKKFQYRIAFSVRQEKVHNRAGILWGSSLNSSAAVVKAYDAKGVELFAFKRADRVTDAGAANAAAKEIIKRLRKLWKLQAKKKH